MGGIALSWKRPNIGSRMNREVHVRIWEHPEDEASGQLDKSSRSISVASCKLGVDCGGGWE